MTPTRVMQTAFATALACGVSLAQPLPDARFLLAHREDELKKHKTYQMEIETSSTREISSITSVFISPPDRIRMESKDLTIIADGEYTWTYIASKGQYTKTSAIGGMFAIFDDSWRNYIAGLKSAFVFTTVRQEKLELDGQVLECWVIEMKPANVNDFPMPEALKSLGVSYSEFSTLYWIDKDNGLERQHIVTGKILLPNTTSPQSFEAKTVHRAITFDEPLPDSLFQFTPPAGAKVADNLMNVPNLTGKAAPKFELKSLDGKSYDLSELKNKVILLDFWASWCAPCRQEIPIVNNLYRDVKEKGIVVIGVDVGEDRQTVEKFLTTMGISYPVALTTGTDIASDYHVTTYPTYIVIGRDGVVAAEQVGRRGDLALRDLVSKAYGKSVSESRVSGLLAAAKSARSSGNFAAAGEAYTAALELAIAKEDGFLSSVAFDAATFFAGQQQPEKEEAVLKRALDAEESSGRPRMRQIPLLMRLRQFYQSRRNFDLVPVDTRLVKAWESGPGSESVVVARSLADLSESLERNGQFADAKKAIQRSITILEKTYGSKAPQLGFALRRLASIETKLGESEPAKAAGNLESTLRPTPSAPVSHVGGGVTAPRVTFKRDPEYTATARKAGVQGSVILSLAVDTNGEATDITVVLPLGEGLDEKAVEAIKAWRFQPGTKDGRPVTVAATVSLEFRLLP